MENVNQNLEVAITNGFEALKDLEIGTKEYLQATYGIRELYKLKIEEDKIANEMSDRERRDKELRLKRDQLKVDEKHHAEEMILKRDQMKVDEKHHAEEMILKRDQMRFEERRNIEDVRLKETQIRNEEKRSRRIKPDVILSCIASTVTVIGILLYEKSDVLTTKAINYVPKIKF